MCSPLLVVETWLLTESGSQFINPEKMFQASAAAPDSNGHDKSETDGLGGAGRKASPKNPLWAKVGLEQIQRVRRYWRVA